MPYRDDHLICIELGSYETRSIFGLSESLAPPQRRTKTRIGKLEGSESYICGEDLDQAEERKEPVNIIRPLVSGSVHDWDALTAFLKHLIYVLTGESAGSKASEHPVILIVPPQWSTQDKERTTQIFFEQFQRPAFMIIDTAIASLYACNSITGLVIDVGYEKTDITSVIDSITSPSSQISLPIGGHHLTNNLLKLLRTNIPLDQATQSPIELADVNYELAETIKHSAICEVRVDASSANGASLRQESQMEEEGVLDIAAVLASGKTREYLARAQAEKNGVNGEAQEVIPNAKLSHNTIEVGSRSLVVGNDRFLACDGLLLEGTLTDAIYNSIMGQTIDPARRNELWENIVLVGGGSRVPGFKENLIQRLQLRFGSALVQASADPYSPALYAAYPTAIRTIRIPVHFPEWNSKEVNDSSKGVNEEATFLGACIIAHIAFASSETGPARLYVTKADFNEQGSTAI